MKRLCIFLLIAALLTPMLFGCSQQTETGEEANPAAQTPSAPEPEEQASEAPSETAFIIEPEQLISKEEAEQILGEAVLDGEKIEQPVVGQKLIFYDAQNEDSDRYLQISINQDAYIDNDFQSTAAIYETTKDAIDETAEEEEIDGVGEEYFFGTPGLHIFTDGYYLCIAAESSDSDAVLGILREAGALAVKNLKELVG